MPELGTYGSVRGALSNERPYRDQTDPKLRRGLRRMPPSGLALASKNLLTAADARLVELAFALRLSAYEPVAGAKNLAQKARWAAEEAGRSLGHPEPESSASEPRSRVEPVPPRPSGKPAGTNKNVLAIPGRDGTETNRTLSSRLAALPVLCPKPLGPPLSSGVLRMRQVFG
jgi:hypothetical protein